MSYDDGWILFVLTPKRLKQVLMKFGTMIDENLDSNIEYFFGDTNRYYLVGIIIKELVNDNLEFQLLQK